MYLIACLRSYIKLLFAGWKHCILFLWGWVFQPCMVILFHVYHAERVFPHQHLGFICIVYFITFKQNSNLLSVFSDGHMGKKTLRWIYNIIVPQGARARSTGHFGAMWQLLVCVHSYRRICLIGPYLMQVASKFILATVFMLYSGYNRKYFVLLFLTLATPNAPILGKVKWWFWFYSTPGSGLPVCVKYT